MYCISGAISRMWIAGHQGPTEGATDLGLLTKRTFISSWLGPQSDWCGTAHKKDLYIFMAGPSVRLVWDCSQKGPLYLHGCTLSQTGVGLLTKRILISSWLYPQSDWCGTAHKKGLDIFMAVPSVRLVWDCSQKGS